MIDLLAPEYLTVSELVQAAHREIAAFLRGQPTDDACAFALFRRAIARGDDLAWAGLYDLYHDVVDSWIAREAPALRYEDREALVNDACARFDRSVSAEKLKRWPSVRSL